VGEAGTHEISRYGSRLEIPIHQITPAKQKAASKTSSTSLMLCP
jgi:hypothetical protein